MFEIRVTRLKGTVPIGWYVDLHVIPPFTSPSDVDPSFSKLGVPSTRKCFADPEGQWGDSELSASSCLSALNSFLSPHMDSSEEKEDADEYRSLI